MIKVFQQLGFEVNTQKNSNTDKKLSLLSINNADGSVRWFWPQFVKDPIFLKFYNVGTFKSHLYQLFVKTIFALNLQSRFFKRSEIYISKCNERVSDLNLFQDWAVFTGTKGPNNKLVIYTKKSDSSKFIKIAHGDKATDLIKNEVASIEQLANLNITSFTYPRIIAQGKQDVQLTNISEKGKRVNRLNNQHWDSLIELNQKTRTSLTLNQVASWQRLKNDLSELALSSDNRLPKGMISKLSLMIDDLDENEIVEFSMSHGDFTPWNMFQGNEKLSIYDWELSEPLKPIGFDLFHFIIQQGILVEHESWTKIYERIQNQINKSSFSNLSQGKVAHREFYLKMYLIYNTVYYLKLYSSQAGWHTQIYWLFNVWNEGLSFFLRNTVSKRKLIIMDTFDFLINHKYAAVKFPNMKPENLDEFSDIDLVIKKEAIKPLIKFYSKHPIIQKMDVERKSFMTSISLKSEEVLLNLDLIVKFKRAGLEFLDAENVLKNSYQNKYGVKVMDVFDTARYIALFYALNKTLIPKKYSGYDEILQKSNNPLDRLIFSTYLNDTLDVAPLIEFIKNQKENQGCKGFKNNINYIIDSIRSFSKFNGVIVTFSGVDGAGKSTVIQHLKFKIEKKLRKRVVILRHRPSILPILSAITKGKKEAELHAANNLPRQGSNSSFISSSIRFAYYYLDYLLGQFLVQIKYVWRGYIVIYDRYYFDFMNDSKRSNIELPPAIFNVGYKLIMKPQLNFFLYADAETILKRKQELDSDTISQLTNRYLNLFENLAKGKKKAEFISIKNDNLNITLDKVYDRLAKAAI